MYRQRLSIARPIDVCKCTHHYDVNHNNLTIFHRCDHNDLVYVNQSISNNDRRQSYTLQSRGDNGDDNRIIFNYPPSSISIPSHLYIKSVLFTNQYNLPIEPGDLPHTITYLELSPTFNQPLQPGAIPPSTTYLKFGPHSEYDQPFVSGALPMSLRTLELGRCYNQQINPGALPSSLTSLKTGGFNQPLIIGALPSSLIDIELVHYNQPIGHGVLPDSLTSMQIRRGFCSVIEPGMLPQRLTTLDYHNYESEPLCPGWLPDSLTRLTLHAFEQELTQGILSKNLQYLTMGMFFNLPLAKGSLPDSLLSLKLGRMFNQSLDGSVLPRSLTHLHFECNYSQRLTADMLPSTLTSLSYVSDVLANCAPDTFHHCRIQHINISKYFTRFQRTLPHISQFNEHLRTLTVEYDPISPSSLMLKLFIDTGILELTLKHTKSMVRRIDPEHMLVVDNNSRMFIYSLSSSSTSSSSSGRYKGCSLN
ncbi:hypothetical protein SAMD00019534_001810 [Acytostelium subglobosum LB1]|uniref:hypothetical protein n=1 Tax=Acytostelium subglobosum LB1 TaxID=1410327 RepID=UPI000644D969|nr:hypothetical protein SAMD00019534_001810 [Acytostelium subglobosum LB1]GAM17006.1 hypothetical protein SAMD00019534_001810 [Acytostelium subglobosum LB1]|eukprot:XP_012759068.1 hypothetical protein SAMD00019534_001810 [Acytostelium subglobosum LB1]